MSTPDWLPALAEKLRWQAADLVVEHGLPGLVVGVAAGEIPSDALAWGYGFGPQGGPATPNAHGHAIGPDTLFRVASITKTFTATAIVQLRDAGKLHLDDPLVHHVPEFAAVSNPFGRIEDVTLRRLASHSSGLMGEPPGDHWMTLQFPTRAQWLAALPQVKVAIPPGSAFKYSNLAYTLLGEVIERVSGQEYTAYMQRAIFGPLGMTSTTFEPAGELLTRAATGHQPHPYQDEAQPAPPSPLNGMAAAGQLWTTARDLSRWISSHCRTGVAEGNSSQPLAVASLAEMQRAVYVEPNWSGGYGVGWRIVRHGDRVFHGHGGSVPGYRSQILFDTSLKVGVVVLIDGVGMADVVGGKLMDTLAECVAAAEAARPAGPLPPTPPAYQRFLGMYRMRNVGDIGYRIEYRQGKLHLKESASMFPGAPPITLEPTAEPAVFMVRGGRYSGEPLIFSFTPDGRTEGFTASGFSFFRLTDILGAP